MCTGLNITIAPMFGHSIRDLSSRLVLNTVAFRCAKSPELSQDRFLQWNHRLEGGRSDKERQAHSSKGEGGPLPPGSVDFWRSGTILMTMLASSPSLPATVSCPKLPRHSKGYRYYAGYSRPFVYDILSRWPSHALVLDPWNGSGTTTTVAAELGLECVGVDLNPAMVVVARAALISEEDILVIRRQARGCAS